MSGRPEALFPLFAGLETLPSYQQMLGLIARAAGYRNYPHLRAQTTTAPRADA